MSPRERYEAAVALLRARGPVTERQVRGISGPDFLLAQLVVRATTETLPAALGAAGELAAATDAAINASRLSTLHGPGVWEISLVVTRSLDLAERRAEVAP